MIGVFLASELVTVVGLSVFWDVQPAMIVSQMGIWRHFDPTPITLFQWTVILLSLVPNLCISAKRWHDRNHTGWFALIGPVQLALAMAALAYGPDAVNRTQTDASVYQVITAVSGILTLWVLIDCGILDGTKGPNRYGPSPKGAGGSSDVF